MVTSLESECETIFKGKETWNCEDYEYFFVYHHGENLETTLKCLDYEKYLTPNELEVPLDINGTIELKKLDYLNVEIFVSIVFTIHFICQKKIL